MTFWELNVAVLKARLIPRSSRLVGFSARVTVCPVSRPMMSTTGRVRPTQETRAPWARLTTRCPSPPQAARTVVIASGKKTWEYPYKEKDVPAKAWKNQG